MVIKPKLLFLHMPKSAGTSLRSYLIDQYHDEDVFQKNDWMSINTFDLDEIVKYRLIIGHFDYRMIKLLPAGYKTVIFLREPIARTISAIQHAMRDTNFWSAKPDIEGKTFKEIIRDPEIMKWFANGQVSLLAANCPRDLIIEQYQQRKDIADPLPFLNDVCFDQKLAIKHLKKIDFVGIMEQFDQSLLHLADLFGFYPPKATPFLNKNCQNELCSLDDEDMTILAEHNTLDIKLYQHALEISAQQVPLQRDICLRKYFSSQLPIVKNILVDLVSPFSGWGFYEAEKENGLTYRWSGPYDSSGITIKLAHGRFKLKFKYYLDAKQFAQSVQIYIGNHKPEAKVWKEMGYHYYEIVLDIHESNGEIIDFILKVDRTISPSIWGDQDIRKLGFMFLGIDIRCEEKFVVKQQNSFSKCRTIVVSSNCQTGGLAASLQAIFPQDNIVPFPLPTVGGTVNKKVQLSEILANCDVWVSIGQLDLIPQHTKPNFLVIKVPVINFSAFHPDLCYAKRISSNELLVPHYNSAIAIWAYKHGLSISDAKKLFNKKSYDGLGYFDEWSVSVTNLSRSFDECELDFNRFFLSLKRVGVFMHSINHPKIITLVGLGKVVSLQLGKDESIMDKIIDINDGLSAIKWPVYLEIADEYSFLDGSYEWKMDNKSYLPTVEDYLIYTYKNYNDLKILKKDLMFLDKDETLYDLILGKQVGIK